MVSDALKDLNLYAVLRFALGYPDEERLEFLRRLSPSTPANLEDLRALYIQLFEAALPQPACPLLESFYVESRPAPEVVLENKLFYQHFGLRPSSKAAPDHLLTQLEFLGWIEHCLAAGNPDRASLENARRDFLERHVLHWIARAAQRAQRAGGGCYAEVLKTLSRVPES
jgi:DMSO reductase family type II enzyme chaperone